MSSSSSHHLSTEMVVSGTSKTAAGMFGTSFKLHKNVMETVCSGLQMPLTSNH
jgi:hypothetical protein